MNRPRRMDPEAFEKMLERLGPEEIDHRNQSQHELNLQEYERFKDSYSRGECYLCGKPFKTISKEKPCLHWLLRRCKFKAKDFPKLYREFDYHQIESYLRWIANEERFQGNINDLKDERSEKKVFQTTIQWKNIEWTFECSESDYQGHEGTKSDFPHFHFQMRIEERPFIKFNSHHIPFSERDLFNLDLVREKPDIVHHDFGPGGSGMQEAVEIEPQDIVENTTLCEDEAEATYHIQTMIKADKEPISGDAIVAMAEESRKTGKPMASLVQKYLGESVQGSTVVSPSESVPKIAKRTARKRNNQ